MVVKNVQDGSGTRRKAFLVEWEGGYGSTWVASDYVSQHLDEEFWVEGEAVKSDADVVVDVKAVLPDMIATKTSRRKKTQIRFQRRSTPDVPDKTT